MRYQTKTWQNVNDEILPGDTCPYCEKGKIEKITRPYFKQLFKGMECNHCHITLRFRKPKWPGSPIGKK